MRRHLPEPVLDESVFLSLGPIIEPPFADAHPGEVTAVLEDVREVASEPWDPPLTADLAARALAVALDSLELEGARYEVIGVGMTGGKRHRPCPTVVIYRYDDDVTIDAILDAEATAVTKVDVHRDQPILTEAEEQRAREIAARAPEFRRAGIDPQAGMGLVIAELDPAHERYGHRLADLRYAPPDHRNPQAYAIVDLSTDELVEFGVYGEGAAA